MAIKPPKVNAKKPATMMPAPPPPPPAAKSAAPRSSKTFKVETWDGDKEGEKIMLYAHSGRGKTTLSAMAPNPVFIGVDDGGRKIKNALNGEALKHIPGILTYSDYLAALGQTNLFDKHDTVVIDTLTKIQELALDYMLATIPTDSGKPATHIEQYGWGKGYRNMVDIMRLMFPPLEELVRRGKNIIMVCQLQQINETNAGGNDFLMDAPDLFDRKNASVMRQFIAWTDHIFKLEYDQVHAKEKKASSRCDRIVRTQAEIHYFAKSRGDTFLDRPVVSFEHPADDSLWQFLFGEAS